MTITFFFFIQLVNILSNAELNSMNFLYDAIPLLIFITLYYQEFVTFFRLAVFVLRFEN